MKCVLFGSGGREAIMAEKLSELYELYAYIAHENPTIIQFVNKTGGKYIIDKTYDEKSIISFLNEHNIDICVVNSDNLLAKGVIDIAKNLGLLVFGPTKEGARLEWDKSYATSLIKKVAPEALVKTTVVCSREDLLSAIKNYDNLDFVIKPNGLTGGKGVKVGGMHFFSKEEALDYAGNCLNSDGRVIIQDKISGHEFTIMGFTNGKDIVMAPCTYDYPYRYDSDKGPGTGGMGTVSFANGLLPFLNTDDLAACKNIMTKALLEINRDEIIFNGVINGGFFKTDKGIFFMEFNARLGDPEALNVLSLLKTPFCDLVRDIAQGEVLSRDNCTFTPEYSYVVYVVSKAYAIDPDASPIEFSLDENLISGTEASFYSSNMRRTSGGNYSSVGNSRLFALVKTGENLKQIKSTADNLLSLYIAQNPNLDYRKDIGITI